MQDIGADLERLQEEGQQFLGGDAARNRQIANATAMPGTGIGLNPQRVRDVAENGGGPGGANLYNDGPSGKPPGPEVRLASGPGSRQGLTFNPWQGTNPEQSAALAAEDEKRDPVPMGQAGPMYPRPY